MGATINNETTTEPPPYNGQQPKHFFFFGGGGGGGLKCILPVPNQTGASAIQQTVKNQMKCRIQRLNAAFHLVYIVCFQIEKKSVGTGIHMIRIILHVTPQNIMDDPILVVLIYVVASIGFKRLKF